MHMSIRAIVYAKTAEAAKAHATEIFDSLCGEGNTFDYFTVMGKPLLADSKAGKEIIDGGMEATQRDFLYFMTKVREALAKYSDMELFEEQANSPDNTGGSLGMVKHYMHSAGEYKGTTIWMYDDSGEGIRSRKDLYGALSMHADSYQDVGIKNPQQDNKVWVVMADVHS